MATEKEIDNTLNRGHRYPYDAPDAWWEDSKMPTPPPDDAAHAAARGVIADLTDRRDIKRGFEEVDESVRKEIVETLAAVIRRAYETCGS